MFRDLIESTKAVKKTNKRWTVALSTSIQALILGILVMIPLMHTEALPKAMFSLLLVVPPPPPPLRSHPMRPARPGASRTAPKIFVQPSVIPKNVDASRDPEPPPELINDAATTGIFNNIPGQDILDSNRPAIPPGVKPPVPVRIKQGGNVTAAAIISQARPAYSALARQAHIQGSVVLHAIIDKDGNVAQLEVISGHPLLVQAALDAVKQWRYRPTLLNGDPVEVDTTITVTFTMNE